MCKKLTGPDWGKLDQATILMAASRVDPSGTAEIRREYEAAMVRRFKRVRRLIVESVDKNDCFGLRRKPGETGLIGAALTVHTSAIPGNAFAFVPDSAKTAGFHSWLKDVVEKDILELSAEAQYIPTTHWQGTFMRKSWKKAHVRAKAAVMSARAVAKYGTGADAAKALVGDVLADPFHADRIKSIYARNFALLNGVTHQMSWQIGEILSEGLARGYDPKKMARLMADRVDKIGIHRARMIARTEVIRANAEATLTTFEQFQVRKVTVFAEWVTAGFDVCPLCLEAEAKTRKNPLTIAEARGRIPLHPNCRCSWVPIVPPPVKGATPTATPVKKPPAIPEYRRIPAKLADDIRQGRGFLKRGLNLPSDVKYNMQYVSDEARREAKRRIEKALGSRLAGDSSITTEEFLRAYPEVGGYSLPSNITREEAARKVADRLVHQWAITSGDSNDVSIALQLAIREEFGLKESGLWWWESSFKGGLAKYEDHRNLFRRFARHMYENTQDDFALDGITHLTLFRGQGMEESLEELGVFLASRSGQGFVADIALQPASSFSTNMATALQFATGKNPAILTVRVPVSQIIGTARTGTGCLSESEFVVLGKPTKTLVTRSSTFTYSDEWDTVLAKVEKWFNAPGGIKNIDDAIQASIADDIAKRAAKELDLIKKPLQTVGTSPQVVTPTGTPKMLVDDFTKHASSLQLEDFTFEGYGSPSPEDFAKAWSNVFGADAPKVSDLLEKAFGSMMDETGLVLSENKAAKTVIGISNANTQGDQHYINIYKKFKDIYGNHLSVDIQFVVEKNAAGTTIKNMIVSPKGSWEGFSTGYASGDFSTVMMKGVINGANDLASALKINPADPLASMWQINIGTGTMPAKLAAKFNMLPTQYSTHGLGLQDLANKVKTNWEIIKHKIADPVQQDVVESLVTEFETYANLPKGQGGWEKAAGAAKQIANITAKIDSGPFSGKPIADFLFTDCSWSMPLSNAKNWAKALIDEAKLILGNP